MDVQHLVSRDALGDADDRAYAGVDRLVDRVRGEGGGHEHHRRVRLRYLHGRCDRVEDRDPVDFLAALAGSHAGDDVRAVRAVA